MNSTKQFSMLARQFLSISLLLVSVQPSRLAAADAPDLTGVVKSKSGEPLPGASVFIYTAGPRVGSGVI